MEEAKRIDDRLSEAQAHCRELERILEGTPQAIVVTTDDGLIRRANPAACELLGFPCAEFTDGRFLQGLCEGDADRELFEPLLAARARGLPPVIRLDLIGITKDRLRIPLRVSAHLFDDALGGLSVAHFLSPIPNVVEMEQKLEEAQLQLIHADKMASLGKLAAGVAHEMNNPLGGILLFGSLLLDDLEPADPRRESVARILQEARRCSETVSSLLDFAHQRNRHRETVELGAAVRQCLVLMGGKALFNNIEVDLAAPEDLPTVTGNPSQLKQVFTNILSNAVDAMQGDGKLVIRLYARPQGREVCVSFRDTGPGIPPSALSRLFDPFFTTKEPGKGTGLGLSLSYNIVKMHRGEIRAVNAPDGGAEFLVTLPVSGEEGA